MTNAWFGNITTEVAFDPTVSVTAKAVYLVLACHADMETGECWVSNTTTARHLGVSRVTVVRAMNELCETGLVTRTPRFYKGQQSSNLITLVDVRNARRQRT